MKKLFITMLAFILFPMMPANAVKVRSLYRAEIPVESQSDAIRSEAIKQGFMQVLIKVSGDTNLGKNQIIALRLQRASGYVEEYSYQSSSLPSTPYLIEIRYDKKAVNKLLKNAGVSYWGDNRPLILVWLSMAENAAPAEMIGDDAPNSMKEMMKQNAKKYGLPFIFPVMDVTDINQISTNDVLSASLPILKKASQRYSPDAFLIGKIESNGDRFQGQWEFVLGNNQWHWTLSDTMENMITTLMNEISHTLAKHYAVVSNDAKGRWITLEVTHITDRTDLSRLMQYFKQLAPVDQVQLSQISGDAIELQVLIHGSVETFQQHATVLQHLALQSQDLENNKLVYQWIR